MCLYVCMSLVSVCMYVIGVCMCVCHWCLYVCMPLGCVCVHEQGWFKTGDVAVEENGAFRILGRASVDIIKSVSE